VVEGLNAVPGSDALKHFGAAMASFGSIALFHLVGITPEAMRIEDVGGDQLPVAHRVGEADIKSFQTAFAAADDIDVVVFSAPQLSLYELRELASRQKIPLAIVFNTVNPILVQGAAFSGMTMLAGFDEDITIWVENGAIVEIDPARKLLRLL
jgi:predicted aconitase